MNEVYGRFFEKQLRPSYRSGSEAASDVRVEIDDRLAG
jgi:hypothetical protein